LVGYDDTSFVYDANGALTQKETPGGTTTYERSVRGRLARVETPQGDVQSHQYGPEGQRLVKTVNGETTYMIYGLNGLLAELDESGNVQRKFGWLPGGVRGANPLWLTSGDETYYYVNDHRGTPRALLKRNGAVAWSAQYAPFGEVNVETAKVVNPIRFAGQYDDSFGGYQNGQRTYHPDIGRYGRQDPLGVIGGLNTYRYARNDPIHNVDPRGELALTTACAIGAGVGAAWSFGKSLWSGDGLGTAAAKGASGAAAGAAATCLPYKSAQCAIGAAKSAYNDAKIECKPPDPYDAAKACALGMLPGPSGRYGYDTVKNAVKSEVGDRAVQETVGRATP
jgi:RHS repeat-associated protein